MRRLLLLVVVAGCQFAIGKNGSTFVPRADERVVVVELVLQHELGKPYPSERDRRYEALAMTLLAALRRDAHVRVDVVSAPDANADYVVHLDVTAGVAPRSHCVRHSFHLDKFLAALVKDRSEGDPITCDAIAPDPSVASAVIELVVVQPRRGRHAPMLVQSWTAANVEAESAEALLATRIAEATAWIDAHVPTLFASEAVVTDDALPIGTDRGVRVGDAFEIYRDRAPVGIARVRSVDANHAELERAYGGGGFADGDVAMPRGRPWLVGIEPALGIATAHTSLGTSRDATLGLHLRTQRLGSGPVVGLGSTLILGADRGVVLGPEAGWAVRIDPHVELHALATIDVVNTTFASGGTRTGAAAATFGGATLAMRFTYATVEAGYAWTTRIADADRAVDYTGPLARVMLGVWLGN